MKGDPMKLLTFDLNDTTTSLDLFLTNVLIFRDAIKKIAPKAQVTLSFASTTKLNGSIVIQNIHPSSLRGLVHKISDFILEQFPTVVLEYSYVDSEDS